jgi:adenylyltransferase/sulfurtransferase
MSDSNNRYDRQLILPGWGESGQLKLSQSHIWVIGCGGLGGPGALALAAAGIGELTLTDPDTINLNNLHRQYFFSQEDVGQLKVEVLKRKIIALRPDIKINIQPFKFIGSPLESRINLIFDGTDTFQAKALINQTARALKIPWVYGSVLGYTAEAGIWDPLERACYTCLYPDFPQEELTCDTAGVAGPLPAMIGNYMSWLGIQYLLNPEAPNFGKVIRWDLQTNRILHFQVERNTVCNPECVNCKSVSKDLEAVAQISWTELKAKLQNHSAPPIWDIRPFSTDELPFPHEKKDVQEIMEMEDKNFPERVILICEQGKISNALISRLKAPKPRGFCVSLTGGWNVIRQDLI